MYLESEGEITYLIRSLVNTDMHTSVSRDVYCMLCKGAKPYARCRKHVGKLDSGIVIFGKRQVVKALLVTLDAIDGGKRVSMQAVLLV